MKRAIRVMSFNLRRDMASDGLNRWSLRREHAASLVMRERPDVLGTQELLPHQVEDFDRALPGYRRLGRCRRGGALDEFNAIYYNPESLDLEESGDFWLSGEPEKPGSATWGNDLPRMATWARFRGGPSVVNTHFDHRSGASRRGGADLILSRFGADAIVIGDFNTLPGSPVHRRMTARWHDTLAAAIERAPGSPGTYHGFTGRPLARIDWILAPKQARVTAHRVVRDRPDGRFLSDHDPVTATLEF